MNEEEIEKSLAETDLALIRLAFCNSAAVILDELSQKAKQAAAQVDTEIIRKIRDMIKKGTANATILAAVQQINETALNGCNANDVLGRVQKIGTGRSILYMANCNAAVQTSNKAKLLTCKIPDNPF